jgi:riboflavin kinase/FMN adenylyltransferase
MRIARSPDELQVAYPSELTLTVGNFDGLHLGHAAVIAEMVSSARARGSAATVVTFDPHPSSVVDPAREPALLSPTNEKLDLLAGVGVDVTLIVDFTAAVAGEDAATFLSWLGVGRGSHLILGYDFHMGRDRQCGLARLSDMGSELGYGLDVVPPVLYGDRPISSSRIRASLKEGAVEDAAAMLGRRYALEGRVVAGASVGGRLGYPTANLDVNTEKLLPGDGVYFATAESLGGLPGLLYVGRRPTFGAKARSVEMHVLDFGADLYGSDLTVAVHSYVRTDRRFASSEELRRQMDRDLSVARELAAEFRGT